MSAPDAKGGLSPFRLRHLHVAPRTDRLPPGAVRVHAAATWWAHLPCRCRAVDEWRVHPPTRAHAAAGRGVATAGRPLPLNPTRTAPCGASAAAVAAGLVVTESGGLEWPTCGRGDHAGVAVKGGRGQSLVRLRQPPLWPVRPPASAPPHPPLGGRCAVSLRRPPAPRWDVERVPHLQAASDGGEGGPASPGAAQSRAARPCSPEPAPPA